MPLFFMVAGLFAYKSMTSPLKTFIDTKVLHFVYFYVLWSLISTGVRGLYAGDPYHVILERLLVPGFTMWFLYGLLLSFIMLRVFRKIPAEFQIAIFSALSSYLMYSYPQSTDVYVRTLTIYPFFLIGVYCSSWIREYASDTNPKKVAVWVIVFFCVYIGVGLSGGLDAPRFYILALVSAAAIFPLMYSLRETAIVGIFSFIGRNSLYVYLMHFFPAAGFRELSVRLGFDDKVFIVLVGTIVSVLVPLLVYFCLRNTWFGFLFSRPKFLILNK